MKLAAAPSSVTLICRTERLWLDAWHLRSYTRPPGQKVWFKSSIYFSLYSKCTITWSHQWQCLYYATVSRGRKINLTHWKKKDCCLISNAVMVTAFEIRRRSFCLDDTSSGTQWFSIQTSGRGWHHLLTGPRWGFLLLQQQQACVMFPTGRDRVKTERLLKYRSTLPPREMSLGGSWYSQSGWLFTENCLNPLTLSLPWWNL